MWHTGLSSTVVNETKGKNRHEHIGTQKRAAQFNRQCEDNGKGGWAAGLADESQNQEKPLQSKKKRV